MLWRGYPICYKQDKLSIINCDVDNTLLMGCLTSVIFSPKQIMSILDKDKRLLLFKSI